MVATKLELYLEQGTTFSRKIIFKDSLGATIDLTGQTFKGQIRAAAGSSAIVAEFTCALLNQSTNKGQMTFSLTAIQTAAISLKAQRTATRTTTDYAYDIERTLVDSTVERVLEGVIKISPEVTSG